MRPAARHGAADRAPREGDDLRPPRPPPRRRRQPRDGRAAPRDQGGARRAVGTEHSVVGYNVAALGFVGREIEQSQARLFEDAVIARAEARGEGRRGGDRRAAAEDGGEAAAGRAGGDDFCRWRTIGAVAPSQPTRAGACGASRSGRVSRGSSKDSNFEEPIDAVFRSRAAREGKARADHPQGNVLVDVRPRRRSSDRVRQLRAERCSELGQRRRLSLHDCDGTNGLVDASAEVPVGHNRFDMKVIKTRRRPKIVAASRAWAATSPSSLDDRGSR